MGWFICASIGLADHRPDHGPPAAAGRRPGAAAARDDADGRGVDVAKFTLKDFVTHLVPTSIVDAMAKNEILQIVVFSVFVGTAVAAIDDRAPAVLALVEQGAAIMLKVTGYVMKHRAAGDLRRPGRDASRPRGCDVLATYAKFVGGFYLSLGMLWALLIGGLRADRRRRAR